MASHTSTTNSTHNANMIVATGVWQAAVAGTPSQATVRAADIAWARTGLASAKANGIATTQFVTMLQELGTGGV